MIAEKILGNINESTVAVAIDYVVLDWFEAELKRMRKTTQDGREIGIAVEKKLSDGDILYIDDDICIAVKIADCVLTKITVSSMQDMGRVCFEIGNRHLSLKITNHEVYIPYDEPTKQHLTDLGFDCEVITGSFDNFIACKAHGNSHSHSHEHHHHE